jgi:hypothetical protein
MSNQARCETNRRKFAMVFRERRGPQILQRAWSRLDN